MARLKSKSADASNEVNTSERGRNGPVPFSEIYIWGLPLVVMHRTRALHCSKGGPGVLRHRANLSTARDRTVVGPNNDTLYSTGWFDLRAGDLRLDVPPMDHPSRYWSVMLLDAFTHVAYVSRRQYGIDGASVKIILDPENENDHSSPSEIIRMGTPTVWVLVRTLVDGPADLRNARRIQENIKVTAPVNHPTAPTTMPPGRPDDVRSAGASFFDELKTALAVDPPAPWHPLLNDEQKSLLAGGADDDVLAQGVLLGDQKIRSGFIGADRFRNGWGTKSKGSLFGSDILLRAAGAQFTLAGHHRVENAAYIAVKDNLGEPLDGGRQLILRFPKDGEPPAGAFWSLTVYGPDMFFYDNPLNRYSIGDRTPGLHRDDNGLAIVIGGDEPEDAANWLPAPAGPYRLGLRVYEGRSDVVDATWFPPPLLRLGEKEGTTTHLQRTVK